eukprot:10338773-Alexandrium_andersonii.AAC.1
MAIPGRSCACGKRPLPNKDGLCPGGARPPTGHHQNAFNEPGGRSEQLQAPSRHANTARKFGNKRWCVFKVFNTCEHARARATL